MHASANGLLVLVLLVDLFLLGASRLRTTIVAVACQGVVLSLLPALLHSHIGLREVLVSLGALALKGIVMPRMLLRALADLPIRREVEPLVGFKTCLLLGALGIGGSLYLAAQLPLVDDADGAARMVVAASFSTILTGFLLLTTRRKALSQVLGYLVLENGIYVFGMLLLNALPFLVEIGVLLDLFVAIFVMGIIIHHISREFTSISTDRLSSLRD